MNLSPRAQCWILSVTVWILYPLNRRKRTDAFVYGADLLLKASRETQ